MTFTKTVDDLIRSCMDSGITASLVPIETAQIMRARLDQLTGNRPEEGHDWDGCLMCAVRALTEGRAKDWGTVDGLPEGATVTGVILRQGVQPSHYQDNPVPYVELWLGDVQRVRVTGHSLILREALISAEPQVGDTLTVQFDGMKEIPAKGRHPARSYKAWTVTIERGHH